MANPATSLPPAARLEANMVQYLQGVFRKAGIAAQILASNSFDEEMEAQLVIIIDAQGDVSDVEMGLMSTTNIQIVVKGQIDGVKTVAHADVVQRVMGAMVNVPRRLRAKMLRATGGLLRAVNKRPGSKDYRAAKNIHLWDIPELSNSLGQADATADTIIVGRANFSGMDWDGATEYGA